MTRRFRTNLPALAAALSLLLTWNAALVLLPGSFNWITVLLGLPVTLLLPGLFIALKLGAKPRSLVTLVFSAGLSILVLIAISLITNVTPGFFGQIKPLDSPTLSWLFNLTYILLAWWVAATVTLSKPPAGPPPAPYDPTLSRSVAAAIALVPTLAVAGAFSLNNNDTNLLALVALGLTIIAAPAIFLLRRRLSTGTLVWFIAAATLTLLLATSLRSWYVSGQDMQHEFQVYNLALQLGHWDIASYRDAYNACLSITLLPVALTHLLGTTGTVIFKLIQQLIFVITPLTIFATTREFLGRSKAFIAALLFIGLPTFGIDVPFISRQEIAFVFVALAVATIFITSQPWINRHRNGLFITLSLGVIVSHYSTSYLFVGPLAVAFIATRLIARFRPKSSQPTSPATNQLSIWAIIAVCLAAYLWLTQITKVSTDLQHKLTTAVATAAHTLRHPLARTTSPSPASSQQAALQHYLNRTITDPSTTPDAVQKQLTIISSNNPDTRPTRWLNQHLGLSLSRLTSGLYYNLGTKLYLLCIAIGLLQLCRPTVRAKLNRLPLLYTVWSAAACLVLVPQMLLPGLTESYGITRAFMQGFILLCLPAIVGVTSLTGRWQRLQNGLLIALSTGLLAIYSGFLPYLTGGLHQQLSLQNSGQYYGTVYPHATDLAAYQWMQDNLPPGSKINTADYAAVYGYYPLSSFDTTSAELLPAQLKPDSYALLSTSQTQDHIVYTFDELIGLRFDAASYNQYDLIYSSGPAQLYYKSNR